MQALLLLISDIPLAPSQIISFNY